MNRTTKKQHSIGVAASLVAILLLLVIQKVWGTDIVEAVGFGLLIGLSYATLFKA